jgi:hypothetical protein
LLNPTQVCVHRTNERIHHANQHEADMSNRELGLAVLTACAIGAAGCTVRHAPGYEELERSTQPQVIEATPYKMYGMVPWSYDIDDGRTVEIDLEDGSRTSGMGTFRLDLRYAVVLGDLRLDCATEPAGPNVPDTRFGCWSPDPDDKTAFWMEPGPNCGARDFDAAQTLVRPECWQGELKTPHRDYTFHYSQMASTGAPVNRISWIERGTGSTAMAASSVTDMRLLLYHGTRSDEHRDLLVLNALALHYWHHMMSGD